MIALTAASLIVLFLSLRSRAVRSAKLAAIRLEQARTAWQRGDARQALARLRPALHVPPRWRWTAAEAQHALQCLVLLDQIDRGLGQRVPPAAAALLPQLAAASRAGGRVSGARCLAVKALLGRAARGVRD
ncbi:MAG TPA: hypothetical protein VND93_01500 [Myxococcales bacterium]|nr:hypothetical protein [Myxococcales bacterium]